MTFSLDINHNALLPGLDGLEALRTVGGSVRLTANSALTSLAALGSLEEVGSLDVATNASLPQCEADWLEANLREFGWTGTPTFADNTGAGLCP